MLNNKSILITGGTGSFGKAFISKILKTYPKIRRLIIFSRDELKQFEMAKQFSEKKYPSIRYFIGDIRDRLRLQRALKRNLNIFLIKRKAVSITAFPIVFMQTTNVL